MVQKPQKGIGSVTYLLHHSFATIFGGLSGVCRACGGDGAQTLVIAPLHIHRRRIQAEETTMAHDSRTPPVVALTEAQRQLAMERFAVLQPHLEADVPLARAARQAGVPVRTAERWLARYRQRGLVGLARPVRSDAAVRRLPADLVTLI
jgi:Helix-turn-helix domain